jgi:hypothetical protein
VSKPFVASREFVVGFLATLALLTILAMTVAQFVNLLSQ